MPKLAERDSYGDYQYLPAGLPGGTPTLTVSLEYHGTTEMLARPAPRPAYSVLRSERRDAIVLPAWRRGLAEYLRERRHSRAVA